MVAIPRSLTSTPPLVLAAGAACLALIGLQLTSDVETPSSSERRELSTYAIDENGIVSCNWTSTMGPTEIPASDYNNTIVVGYPGADKRVVLRQMEAMTELSGRDAWDFKYLGMTLQPFIKTNYPHHEGTWGWAEHGDQVVLVVRNIRKTIDEYHDILADIDYAKTWEEATDKIPNLYLGEVHDELYTSWRDERTMDEIGWYGWLIDYWMEGGILRDYFDHKLTTPEHWALLREPETYTYGELQWDVNNCVNDPLPPISYDTVCDPVVTADCKAKVIISAERLMDAATGHEEHHKIGALLNDTAGVQDVLIDEVAWDCLYDMLISDNPNGTAPDEMGSFHDYRAREAAQGGPVEKHVVSTRHLTKMIAQLTRLITKYSAPDQETGIDWSISPQAQYLVELLSEHKIEIEAELAATPVEQNWAHAPKTNWVVFPKCGDESRRVWDYNYATGYSGLVKDMFPGSV